MEFAMLLPFFSEMLEIKSATICRKALITNVFYYSIIKINTLSVDGRVRLSSLREGF